jgi:hypothetical protein
MNVFEDLVVELQEENLLEKTVIDIEKAETSGIENSEAAPSPEKSSETPDVGEGFTAHGLDETAPVDESELEIVETDKVEIAGNDEYPEASDEQDPPAKQPTSEKDFFQKRAVAEVSSLQMVEHVLTGVEREYMKVVPKTFDDFNAKKALNTFVHLTEGAAELQATQSALMLETEVWCSALAERDRNIQVSSLRQYCENSRPALSSQALLALARFYRNLPYSETVRAKFDFVITRLFSRPTEGEKRVCLFSREETFSHISTLYGEWSSVPLYTADDDQSNVLLTALSFEDLAVEAENAGTFDQLIESDFFSRLRLFKESISELFFAPNVTAAAIGANIRIGNVYVDLIDRERQKMDAESIQSKYGDLNGQTVSEAAARTLDLVNVLRSAPAVAETAEDDEDEDEQELEGETEPAPAAAKKPKPKKARSPFLARLTENALSINKWFLGLAMVLIAASVGIYFWANYFAEEKVSTAGVKVVEIESSALKEHLKAARISGETFYGRLLPSWDGLPKEKRVELLQKVLEEGKERGYSKVNLITKDGMNAGYASATRLDIVMP